MGASDSRERAIANSQLGGGATSWAPGTWYFGLSTTVPNDDGTNFTEPSGMNYARVGKANDTTNFPAAETVSGVTQKKNGTKITWNNPTGNWGPIVSVGLFLTATGGTPEYTFPLDSVITVQNGNTPVEYDVGQLIMNWD